MNERAPTLEKVETLLENHTLPLLVQQRAGARLLLHKSCRIPYVICQSLDRSSQPEEEYFLIPLSNNGFYGAVSQHDQPIHPYNTLSQILQSTTGENPVEILIDTVTPIQQVDKDSKKVINKVLVPGETIHIPKNNSCPILENSSKSSLCCFRPISMERADNLVCVREPSRHLHLQKILESRFYRVSRGRMEKMEPGVVYTIQDITQHQTLPRIVCSIATKSTGRDEMQMPRIFRMIKIISDRVLIAYRLTATNHPHPDDVMELSSYYEELFAIAESSRINMDDIRDHHVNMSIKRALPGKTLSTTDFYEIIRRSSVLPPKLPERPLTLRLKSTLRSTDLSLPGSVKDRTSISSGAAVFNSYTPETEMPRGHSAIELEAINARKLNFTGITTPNFNSSSHTVRLPTRDTSNRSILKKFSTTSLRPDKKPPSLKTILDNYHNKRDNDTNNNDIYSKPKPKKSLRGLEIVHILPDAQPDNVIALSKPVGLKYESGESPESTISSSHSSDVENDEQIDNFIHNHYHFLENHHDSSSHYSTQYSDESTNRNSTVSNTQTAVRFSDIIIHSGNETSSTSRREVRGSVKIPSPDYDQITSPVEKPSTGISLQEEIRRRFSKSDNGGLRSPTAPDIQVENTSQNSQWMTAQQRTGIKTSIPTNPVEELKIRFSNPVLKPQVNSQSTDITDTGAPKRTQSKSVFDSRLRRSSNNNDLHGKSANDDTYLLPAKNVGKIQLTG